MNSEPNPSESPYPPLLHQLIRLVSLGGNLPASDAPLGKVTRDFFENNWRNVQALLAKTRKIRLWPLALPAPHIFRFEIDCRYKRKFGPGSPVELVDGTLLGSIQYRPDLFTAPPDEPSIVVLIDLELGLFHCNYHRQLGVLCLGAIPKGPFPLWDLLEHLYSVVNYQNCSTSDPADLEAAFYFSTAPDAWKGLEVAEPLY